MTPNVNQKIGMLKLDIICSEYDLGKLVRSIRYNAPEDPADLLKKIAHKKRMLSDNKQTLKELERIREDG